MTITHRTLRCLILGAAVAALASCAPTPDTVYVHHTYHHYRSDDSDGGSSLPGATTRLSDPGAPETFRAEGPAQ